MKHLSLILVALFALNAFAAADLTSEMDALGANRELMKKAKAIDPNNRVRVVQNREVDRRLRLEVGLNFGMPSGGDPYVSSSMLGAQVDFHINPNFSIGGRYYDMSNSLSPEGRNIFDDAKARQAIGDTTGVHPGIDWARSTWLAVANWYPIYGKVSLFDAGISQFDLYLLGGAGQTRLGSGFNETTITAGAGAGLWMSKHVSTRLEARWENFKDHPHMEDPFLKRDVNQMVMTATIGFLL